MTASPRPDAHVARGAYVQMQASCEDLESLVTFPDAAFLPALASSTYIDPWDVRDGGAVLAAGPFSVERSAAMSVYGPGALLLLGPDVSLDGTKFLARGRNCVIYVGAGCKLRHVVIEAKGRNSFVAIGAGTTWESGGCIASGEGVHIVVGDDGMISNNVMVRTEDGHGIFDRTSHELVNRGASVVIEPHVWLGNGSKVGKGTRIGRGSVLGGSSVATKNLDAHSVYAGAPAVKVRADISWSRTYSWDAIPDEYR
ncbi:acyltransferase [Chelatococcus reniformis]|uniref:Acyltransferase n=1 Tax=Chelatococcus reniformis TaxID=1494448 RepID=A0A916URS7_9HYPH|nr:acyltransferase [Chelatococcus reniformis]GGC81885.1 hypothetical protein GCM10010994_44780 [Chelatococcus reniformis]